MDLEGLESFFTAGQQMNLFLVSCICGIPLGILFDIFRVIRIMFRHGKAAVMIEDILFFALYSVFVMCFTVTLARSEFRFYYCLGNLLGFVLYHFTIGNFIIGVLRRISEKIKPVLLKPIKKFAPICEKTLCKFVRFFKNKKNLKKCKKTLD